ncbi:MAG TPA: hypothetical protein VI796_01790, partial [Candidatus Thermoplasmatota archaeon]|nr:hypothetical protein [Candidatus Thermoplasmatota archaeon]
MGGRPRHATAWVALLLAAAVAGCSDGGEPAEPLPVASAELREHVLIESYGAVDYALPDDEGLVADALEAWGMEQNPGLADPDLFEAAGLRSALAFGSILARTSDADAQVRSVALEFNRTREAKAWLEAAADLDPLTHFLLHDGRFVTVLTFSESAFLPHLAEAAGYLADFLEKGLECRPGAWPPDGTRGPETGVGSPTIGPHMLLQGRLAGLGEEDWFTVEAVEPAILAVDLLGADQPAPLLDLYDAEGARLAAGVV